MASFNQRYNNLVTQRSDLTVRGKVSDIPATMNYKKDENQNATRGIVESTLLSKVFFSNGNFQIIQNAIRAEVYRLTENKYIIGEQSESQLEIIMRSIYLQNSKNQQTQITQQIEELNKLVLDYCIPQVYNEAIGYMKYCVDVSTLPTPIMRPELSRTYHKQLEFKSWF